MPSTEVSYDILMADKWLSTIWALQKKQWHMSITNDPLIIHVAHFINFHGKVEENL